jgi:hypothetical protein
MKTFVFSFFGGMIGSIPAYTLFSDVGASPFRNFQAVNSKIGGSLENVLLFFALIWLLPAFGAAFGAKLSGHPIDFQWIYGRGIGGQVVFSILFHLLLVFVCSVDHTVTGLPLSQQTIVFLMAAQLGCTFGVVWGM